MATLRTGAGAGHCRPLRGSRPRPASARRLDAASRAPERIRLEQPLHLPADLAFGRGETARVPADDVSRRHVLAAGAGAALAGAIVPPARLSGQEIREKAP